MCPSEKPDFAVQQNPDHARLKIIFKLFIEDFHHLLEDVAPKTHQAADEAMMPFKVRHKITVCMLKKTK